VMKEAQVRLPAAEQLLGSAATPAKIAFNQKFVAGGIEAAANGVFADIVGGMPLALPADKAGGLLAPATKLTSLSLQNGAFPDVRQMLAELTPEQVLDQVFRGKLLGVIELKSIVDTALSSLSLADLPKLTTESVPQGQLMKMHWAPKLTKAKLTGLLRPLAVNPALTVEGSMIRPTGGGVDDLTTDMSGTLRNIGLTFLDMVQVDFNKLSFRMRTGHDPKFDADVSGFRFQGDLSFIAELAEKLPLSGFGGAKGPPVAITPAGVTVSLSVPLPSLSFGLFNLCNLAFSAKLTVLFTDAPATLRVGLSSPENRFLLSYSVFGGGGYLALTAGTDGKVRVDAALEFGGVIAFSITVAKGIVQAMVGILFSMDADSVRLGGYCRIYGCVEILNILTISVEFYMSLEYEAPFAIGHARLTVMVKVLAFAKSVTLEVTRRFSTGSREIVGPEPFTLEQWQDYCVAYA
jgi:hypothetical protein